MELKDHPLLGRLHEDDLSVLETLSSERTLVPAEAIYREDEPATNFFLLLEGRARISCTRPDGGQERLGVVEAGTVLGVAGLSGEGRPATAASMGPGRALEMPLSLLHGPPRTPEGRLAMALREVVALAQNNQLRAANRVLVQLARERGTGSADWDGETNGGWVSPEPPTTTD